MVLIFGGAYQGKLNYAIERFDVEEDDIFHCHGEDVSIPNNKKIIYEIDLWILALIREGADVAESLKDFIQNNQDVIVICNDISCGIVPICEVSRKWREEVGRSMAILAKQSEEVIRLLCGIPIKVK